MNNPGVVERASREISRRIQNLGFNKKRSDISKASVDDVLNGNDYDDDEGGGREEEEEEDGENEGGGGRRRLFGEGDRKTIAKGSVMDKVTHVFSATYEMGNTNNKGKDSSGINIPKGAVANGRAKFEQVSTGSNPKSNPEKPMRFFGSRNRTHSPILPVKTPKVPSSSSTTTTTTITITSTTSTTTSSSSISKVDNDVEDCFPLKNTTIMTTAETSAQINKSSKLFPKMKRFVMWEEMWQDYKFLVRFLRYFHFVDRCILAQVCQRWREILYQPVFWREIRPVLHYRTLRRWNDVEKRNFFGSLKVRGFDSFVLLNANDSDVFDFIQNYPHGAKFLHCLTLRCCNLSDRGLEALMEFLQGLYQLEIVGCNEITEQGLWSSLHPRFVSLTINDCINVADECICAVTQLLPSLYEFNLQAYHVTDSALSYFSPKQTNTLSILRLQSCWEITNHGIVNIVHALPNITVLSLSGCSKLTDDGIELIAENLRKLRSLDVSWCPRVTDAALEYIACDLNHLEELTLDRCVHITDIGIGYISTMLALHTLFLRWCTQIRDFGLQHICGMRSMQILSLAGCPLLSSSGLSNLIQLRHLQELELNNCPGATAELIDYLRQNLPKCLVLD